MTDPQTPATTRKRKQSRGPYRWFICPVPEEPRPDMTSDCPQRDLHTPAPSGDLNWQAWVVNMLATHRQTRCPGCSLWKVFVPKAVR